MESIGALLDASASLAEQAAALVCSDAHAMSPEQAAAVRGQLDAFQVSMVNHFANARVALLAAPGEPAAD